MNIPDSRRYFCACVAAGLAVTLSTTAAWAQRRPAGGLPPTAPRIPERPPVAMPRPAPSPLPPTAPRIPEFPRNGVPPGVPGSFTPAQANAGRPTGGPLRPMPAAPRRFGSRPLASRFGVSPFFFSQVPPPAGLFNEFALSGSLPFAIGGTLDAFGTFGSSTLSSGFGGYGGSYSGSYSSSYGGGGGGGQTTSAAGGAIMQANDYLERLRANEQPPESVNVLTAYGLPNQDGRLMWPLGLKVMAPSSETGRLRDRVEALFVLALGQKTKYGKVDETVVQQMNNSVDQLRQLLAERATDLPQTTYQEARAYLRQMRDAVKLMQ